MQTGKTVFFCKLNFCLQCRDYVRNRRLSEQMNSSMEKEDEMWKNNQQNKVRHQNHADVTKSFKNNTNTHDREPGKITWYLYYFFFSLIPCPFCR